jgi:putative ABC transport system permease protein
VTTFTLAWASLRLHGRRYVAAGAAIILGVGFCAATLVLTAATKKGLGDALVIQYSKADVIARPESRALTADDLRRVESLPSMGSATSWGSGGAEVSWEQGSAETYVEIGEVAPAALRWQSLESGRFPTADTEVVLDAGLAADEGISVGDTLHVAVQRNPLIVDVVGLTTEVKGVDYAPQVFVADGVFDQWLDVGGSDELLVTTAEGTSAVELARDLRGLDLGLAVETAEQARIDATSGMTGDVDILGLMLQAFVAIALIVMGLVIANTFSIMLAQRSRDLALLRCVGAERRQVFAMVVLEALALGVIAAALGTAAGVGLAAVIVAIVNQSSLPVPMSVGFPSLVNIAVPATVGIVVTVVASLGPARRATRVSPLSALRPADPVTAVSRAGIVRMVFGLVVAGLGIAIMLAAISRTSLLIGVAGGAVSFLGVLALTPLIVPAILRVIGVLRRLLPRKLRGGVPVGLSIVNSLRNPRRTAATASALLIGVTLIATLAVGASSMSASASTAIDHNNPIDVTIGGDGPLPPGLTDKVRQVSSLDGVVEISGTTATSRRSEVNVAAVSPADASTVVRDRDLREAFESGRAVVPLEYAWMPSQGRKPTIKLVGTDGVVTLRADFVGSDLGAVMVPASALTELGGEVAPIALWLSVKDDADARSLVSDLDEAVTASGGGVDLSSDYLVRSSLDRALDIMLIVASALLGMAVLIALVGVGNTLSLSVIERSREHAVLRALGLTKGQQRLMLASEATLMALAAALLGVALGVGFGWAGTVTAISEVTDQSAVLDIPWQRLAVIVAIAVLAGLVASVVPSRRATQISPAAALAEG